MLNLTGSQGMAKMNAILKDLQGAGIVIPITSLFSSLIWPLQKSDGFWKMTVDHSRVNQVVILVVDVASFLECINIFSNTWYVATDPVIVFFFFFSLAYQKGRPEFIFTWNR